MVKPRVMVEYRYVSMDFGDQYVMITGIAGMLEWYVENWDMMDVSLLCLDRSIKSKTNSIYCDPS